MATFHDTVNSWCINLDYFQILSPSLFLSEILHCSSKSGCECHAMLTLNSISISSNAHLVHRDKMDFMVKHQFRTLLSSYIEILHENHWSFSQHYSIFSGKGFLWVLKSTISFPREISWLTHQRCLCLQFVSIINSFSFPQSLGRSFTLSPAQVTCSALPAWTPTLCPRWPRCSWTSCSTRAGKSSARASPPGLHMAVTESHLPDLLENDDNTHRSL